MGERNTVGENDKERMAWLWLQCSSCIFISIRFSGTLCIHRVYSTSLCAFQFVLVDIKIFVGLDMLFRCSLEKHCSGVKIGNVGVFFWLDVCSLPFLPHSSPFFSSHDFYAEAQKTALLPIFQCRVYLLQFHMLCFKCLTVCATVSKYNGKPSYGAQTLLSLSLAPLDLSAIRCRCTWISIFLRAVSFAVFVLQFLFLCLFTSLFMCFSVFAITSYVLGSISLSSPPHSLTYTLLCQFSFLPLPSLPPSRSSVK